MDPAQSTHSRRSQVTLTCDSCVTPNSNRKPPTPYLILHTPSPRRLAVSACGTKKHGFEAFSAPVVCCSLALTLRASVLAQRTPLQARSQQRLPRFDQRHCTGQCKKLDRHRQLPLVCLQGERKRPLAGLFAYRDGRFFNDKASPAVRWPALLPRALS